MEMIVVVNVVLVDGFLVEVVDKLLEAPVVEGEVVVDLEVAAVAEMVDPRKMDKMDTAKKEKAKVSFLTI